MGRPFCPDCEESLIKGESAPLVERAEPRRCAVCGQGGTLRYLTYPLECGTPVEMDLCARHFRALLGRCLDRGAYEQLRRKLRARGLGVDQIFLLHDAFYDDQGVALQPAVGRDD
jgi:hypothetical protein